jgi:hypothetical protein
MALHKSINAYTFVFVSQRAAYSVECRGHGDAFVLHRSTRHGSGPGAARAPEQEPPINDSTNVIVTFLKFKIAEYRRHDDNRSATCSYGWKFDAMPEAQTCIGYQTRHQTPI